jgi:hypothetical protein
MDLGSEGDFVWWPFLHGTPGVICIYIYYYDSATEYHPSAVRSSRFKAYGCFTKSESVFPTANMLVPAPTQYIKQQNLFHSQEQYFLVG